MGKGHLCCAKIVNRWGPATQLYFYIMYLAMPSIKSKGRESLLHFVGSVASARHIQTHQTLSDEEDDVLLSDSCAIAISCSDRLWWMPLARFTCKALWVSLVPTLVLPQIFGTSIWRQARSCFEPKEVPVWLLGQGWYCHMFASADLARR